MKTAEDQLTTERRPTSSRLMKSSALEAMTTPSLGQPSYQEDGFLYAVGSLLHDYLQEVSHCETCKEFLCVEPPTDSFISLRKYDINSNLNFPSRPIVQHIRLIENFLERNMNSFIDKKMFWKNCTRL